MKVEVELDAQQRPVRDDERVGATGLEGVSIFLYELAAREALRIADQLFDAVVAWIVRHRGALPEEVSFKIYGPDWETLKSVLVEPTGEAHDWP